MMFGLVPMQPLGLRDLSDPSGLPHSGTVTIHDSVSIGAHTCIDRGTVGRTLIGAHTQIDNHVQIGHNVQIGNRVVVCGQVGIAGSAIIEDDVILEAKSDLPITSRWSSCSSCCKVGVTKNLSPGGQFSGYPAEPTRPRLRKEAQRRRRERS